MAPPDDTDDAPAAGQPEQTVKELLDAKTLADLERWFGLPSFQELAERPPAPEDPELVAKREQRDRAIAAVDPALIEAHRRRVEKSDTLITFQAVIDLRIDPSMARVDLAHIERKLEVAEPREVEISPQLRDDLNECTPQAI